MKRGSDSRRETLRRVRCSSYFLVSHLEESAFATLRETSVIWTERSTVVRVSLELGLFCFLDWTTKSTAEPVIEHPALDADRNVQTINNETERSYARMKIFTPCRSIEFPIRLNRLLNWINKSILGLKTAECTPFRENSTDRNYHQQNLVLLERRENIAKHHTAILIWSVCRSSCWLDRFLLREESLMSLFRVSLFFIVKLISFFSCFLISAEVNRINFFHFGDCYWSENC
jgi:hypothetical protein